MYSSFSFYSSGFKLKQPLNLGYKLRSSDKFGLYLTQSNYPTSLTNLNIWPTYNKTADLNFYVKTDPSVSISKLDLSWMHIFLGNAPYVLWSLFFKLRVSQSNNAVKLLGREFHAFSKIYGKSIRKNRLIPQPGVFFFDIRFGLEVLNLSKFDCKEGFTSLALLRDNLPPRSNCIQIYEAGFFFPSLALNSNKLSQNIKANSRSYSGLKSVNLALFTSAFNFFRVKRKFFKKNSALLTLQKYTVYGGAQKGSRLPTQALLRSNTDSRSKVKSNLVFRLLSLHKNNFFRSLKKKPHPISASQSVSLKKIIQPLNNLKKKRNWVKLASRLSSKATNSLLFTFQTSGSKFFKEGRVRLVNKNIASGLDLKSKELITPDSKKIDVFFKQPLVRYKPGLMRYWRAHRFFFQKYFYLGSKFRQKRLTQYIAKLSNISSFSLYKAIELSVLHVMRTSQLIIGLNLGQLWMFLERTHTYINGIKVHSPYTQVYTGDVLFINTFGVSKLSLHRDIPMYGVKLKSKTTKLGLHPSVVGMEFIPDNPSYLEIDELTSTLVILSEPAFCQHGSNFTLYQPPHITFRMYNWKYTT